MENTYFNENHISDIKKQAIDAIDKLPDDISYEDIMETIYIQQKIAIGLRQSQEGKTISHEDFVKEIKQQQAKRKNIFA